MQNDFVHAWGLDKNLGYCVQVLYLMIYSFLLFLLNHLATYLCTSYYREIVPEEWELWMINMLCTMGYRLQEDF